MVTTSPIPSFSVKCEPYSFLAVEEEQDYSAALRRASLALPSVHSPSGAPPWPLHLGSPRLWSLLFTSLISFVGLSSQVGLGRRNPWEWRVSWNLTTSTPIEIWNTWDLNRSISITVMLTLKSLFHFILRNGVLLCCLGWPLTPGLNWSSSFCLPRSRDYGCIPPHLAKNLPWENIFWNKNYKASLIPWWLTFYTMQYNFIFIGVVSHLNCTVKLRVRDLFFFFLAYYKYDHRVS